MKITVIGGAGRIGSKVVTQLRQCSDAEVLAADLNTAVNAYTGEGLRQAIDGAAVVVDVSDSPSFADDTAMDFFRTATGNVLAAGALAGVAHHVALSIVGVDALDAGYFRAKVAQEQLIAASSIPYSIVHATQFFEFLGRIADFATVDGTVRLPPILVQPMAADDVAEVIARTAVGEPANGVLEVAGPEQFRLDEAVQRAVGVEHDRRILSDADARYFGSTVTERSLVPGSGATLVGTRLDEWLEKQAPASAAVAES